MVSDRELLKEYVGCASQEAFAELVRRHADLVYAAARRQVRDLHLAEDVTQAVFLLLASKAGSVRGPLAGWLIKATWYVARNARRLARIRQRHERKVAEMNSRQLEASVPEPGDRYSVYIDEAMAELSTSDRAAISLRFLRGFELAEVALEMGISTDAARKRVERSVTRLRALVSAKTAVPTTGVLAMQLATMGLETAPAKLVTAIVSAGGKAASGTLGGALAGGASKAMAWAKVKVAAAVFLATSLAAGGAGVAIQLGVGGVAAPAAAASVPPSVPVGTEAKVPGEMQLAIWDVLLNDRGAKLVEGLGRPVKNASRVYQPRICSGEQLRAAVASALDAGGVARVSHRMRFADFPRGKENYWGMNPQLVFDYPPDDQASPWNFRGSSDKIGGDDFVRIDANHMAVKLNHVTMYAGVQERPAQNLQAPPGQAIFYDGQLAAGEALAFLARIPARQAGAYYHLVVWETFKAQPTQSMMMEEQRDAGWWCRNGPQTLRGWADVARVWAPNSNGFQVSGDNSMERKLSDGNAVYLVGLTRPSKWPFCWWNPHGAPTFSFSGSIPWDGDLPGGLWARLTVTYPPGKSPNPWERRPSDKPSFYGSPCQRIAETGPIEVGIPVGGWEDIARMKLGETVVAENVSFTVCNAENKDFVRFTRTGLLDDQYLLVVVDKSGKESKPQFDWTEIKWGKDTRPGTVTESVMAYPIPVQDRETCIVLRHKRQWVSFDGFAANPLSPPPAAIVAGQADQKEADLKRQREEQNRLGRIAIAKTQREAWEAMETGPGTPGEMLQILDRAIRASDTAAVRRMFTSPKAGSEEVLDEMAHLLVVGGSVHAKAVELFGADAADGDLSIPAFVPVMANRKWTKSSDGTYHDGGNMFVLRPQADGRLVMEPQVLGDKDQVKSIAAMVTQLERLDRLLRRNPQPTLQEAKAAMNSQAAGR